MIARSYAATYDMPVAVTRLANVYGPGDVNWARSFRTPRGRWCAASAR